MYPINFIRYQIKQIHLKKKNNNNYVKLAYSKMNLPIYINIYISKNNMGIQVQGSFSQFIYSSNLHMFNIKSNHIFISKNNTFFLNSIWGTYRALLKNKIVGVSYGYHVQLNIIGVGFNAILKKSKQKLDYIYFKIGYSHPIIYYIPKDIHIMIKKKKKIDLFGIDLQKLSQIAARLSKLYKKDYYKGKGIIWN